jgi:predicted nuclease of predicted toxin-antitoxin system
MKLLFDAHLAPSLVKSLGDCFPGSEHVFHHNLQDSDQNIWEFAAQNSLSIVTKDDDFVGMALIGGPPPKVIQLRVGNCRTAVVEAVLREHLELIADFVANSEEGLLVLRREIP